MPAMGRHGAFVMPDDDELGVPRMQRSALAMRCGSGAHRKWVPALRCTAEEALHRVRDTRGVGSTWPIAIARKTKFLQANQADFICPVLSEKIFRFPRRANHLYKLAPSRLTEGRLAIVTNARRDAVDAFGASRRRACKADGEVVWS
jgi:hypothetical protein